MASGGARNRSGPQADPTSGRSARRGLTLTALPSTYDGEVPSYPLPDPSERELSLWSEAWTWPQANGWSQPEEAARRHALAMWVRTSVRCEAADAPASLLAQVHRFADQAALTPAGMVEAGWAYSRDELAARRDNTLGAADESSDARPAPVRRLRA